MDYAEFVMLLNEENLVQYSYLYNLDMIILSDIETCDTALTVIIAIHPQ